MTWKCPCETSFESCLCSSTLRWRSVSSTVTNTWAPSWPRPATWTASTATWPLASPSSSTTTKQTTSGTKKINSRGEKKVQTMGRKSHPYILIIFFYSLQHQIIKNGPLFYFLSLSKQIVSKENWASLRPKLPEQRFTEKRLNSLSVSRSSELFTYTICSSQKALHLINKSLSYFLLSAVGSKISYNMFQNAGCRKMLYTHKSKMWLCTQETF